METKIEKELRFLKAYAVASTLIFAVFVLTAFTVNDKKQKFGEIDVGRINLVEKDGTRRMIITNRERSPDIIKKGKDTGMRTGYRSPGMFFYNSEGDEVGGLVFDGFIEKGKPNASSGLFLDQFNQGQTVGLSYWESEGLRSAGLTVWDKPENMTSFAEFQKREAIKKMPDGAAKTEAEKKLEEEAASPIRVFVGKRRKAKDAGVFLFDANGKPRIRMMVTAENKPKFEFLDENGKVTYSLPDSPAK